METTFSKDVLEFIKKEEVPPAVPLNPMTLGRAIAVVENHQSIQMKRSVEIGPELALALLGSNEAYFQSTGKAPNRGVSKKRTTTELTVLAKTMEENEFYPSASLGITTGGRVVDGQGRLMCIVRTGKRYRFDVDVLTDTDQSVSRYITNNRLSTAAATPTETGEIVWGMTKSEASLATQIAQGVAWYEKEILGSNIRPYDWTIFSQGMKLPEDIRQLATLYAKIKTPKGINKAALATIELLARRSGYSSSKVELFREGLITGNDLKARDPRKMLRDFLIQRTKGSVLRYQQQAAYIKSAFDSFIANKDVSKVSSKIVRF